LHSRARPERTSMRVDLPAPLGPMRARISPSGTAMSTPSRATKPPNRRLNPLPSSANTVSPSRPARAALGHRGERAAEAGRQQDGDRDQRQADHRGPMLRVVARDVLEEEEDQGAQSRSPQDAGPADDR